MKRLVVMLALAAAIALMPVSAAYADSRTHVSGTYTSRTQVLDVHYAGPNRIVTLQVDTVYSGDITGTASGIQTDIVHADGSMQLYGGATCECTIRGVTYVIDQHFTASGTYGVGLAGRWVATGGPVQGNGTMANWYGSPATYEGWVHLR